MKAPTAGMEDGKRQEQRKSGKMAVFVSPSPNLQPRSISFSSLPSTSLCSSSFLFSFVVASSGTVSKLSLPLVAKGKGPSALPANASAADEDDLVERFTESEEENLAADEHLLDAKLQQKLELKMKMKLTKKVKLRRKKLLRKRRMRKKGQWPPSKMKKP